MSSSVDPNQASISGEDESSAPPPPPPKRRRVPLETMKDGPSMDPKERVCLEAVERGDKHTVERCLQGPSPVSVNCTDMLGRSALQIAVDNENIEIMELLLRDPSVRVGSALLQAIREGGCLMVEMLINHPSMSGSMLASDWAGPEDEDNSEHSPDISPVMLAAHCNQFEIVQLMLSRGAMIHAPHNLQCHCQKCQVGKHKDSLRHSLHRINTYRALSSPAWISLTSDDPILTAFQLSRELDSLAHQETEFKGTYLELSQQCKNYSCDLLSLCRSTDEVIAVLDREEPGTELDQEPSSLALHRLKLALKYEQKQFVAHPNSQQLLSTIWFSGLPSWRRRSGPARFLLCTSLIAALPLVSLFYLLFPRSRMGSVIQSPFMKFMYHSASFGCFLLLILVSSVRNEGKDVSRQNVRGPPLTPLEGLVYFWVLGMVWGECKQVWEEGLHGYVRQCWNWLDFIMLSLYLASCALRAVATWLIGTGKYGPRIMERANWPKNDPTLIAEGIFAIAGVFSFARIIYLFQTNPHLGPLQISLGCMVKDIVKFLFIFFLVITSFACGLNQLYWYYEPDKEHCVTRTLSTGVVVTLGCEKNPDAFATIGNSYASLFWALFGVSSPKSTDLALDEFKTVENLGQSLYLAYHLMAIIVLINMLIAMMTKSFEVIENHADMEWKFARSKLWLGHFEKGSTLPPPFNLLVSPKSLFYTYQAVRRLWRRLGLPSFPSLSLRKGPTDEITLEEEGKTEREDAIKEDETSLPVCSKRLDYQEVMRLLVTRYIHRTKLELRQDGVNEDDLLEIKQDISSLRFELREDRKREASRTAVQIENVKRDIIRCLRSVPAPGVRRTSAVTLGEDLSPADSAEEELLRPAARKSRGSIWTLSGDVSRNTGLLSRQELEAIRKSVVDQLRTEIFQLTADLRLRKISTTIEEPNEVNSD